MLANETAESAELLRELREIGAARAAKYLVVVPDSPIETGAAATHGPLDVWEATKQAAQEQTRAHGGDTALREPRRRRDPG